jgi:Divergent InlB B-repeat domain
MRGRARGSCLFLAAGFAVAVIPIGTALDRVTTDRPDDVAGPQVHVLYAVPSDTPDRELDTNGTIERSVKSWQEWLKGQTGGRGLRLDTFGGLLDISFVRLTRTKAEVAADISLFYSELRATPFTLESKLYAVYYDGDGLFCGYGGGPYPALLLQATDSRTGFPCPTTSLGLIPPGWSDFAMLHEIVHSLGYVTDCAPHYALAHVNDSDLDLMWGGSPWGDLNSMQLDVGHDDYYLARIPGCPDLSGSRFLEGSGDASLAVTVDSPTGAQDAIAVNGNGFGQSPAAVGFSCTGATCTKHFDTWPVETMEIEPRYLGPLEEFAGWSGACTGTKTTCTISVDGPKAVTAHFRLRPAPTLTVSIRGRGQIVSKPTSISCPQRCVGTFPFDSAVDLLAKPALGWRFLRWTDQLDMCGRAARCEMIVEDADSLRATFVRRAVPVRVSIVGAGRVTSNPSVLSCPRRCSANVLYGGHLTLRARPATGWRFAGWVGACRGGRSSCALRLTGRPVRRDVRARFVR